MLRETLRTLRDDSRRYAGVVLTGIGGVGKSAVAGRAMRRLVESGYLVAAHVGKWNAEDIAVSDSGTELLKLGDEKPTQLAMTLARPEARRTAPPGPPGRAARRTTLDSGPRRLRGEPHPGRERFRGPDRRRPGTTPRQASPPWPPSDHLQTSPHRVRPTCYVISPSARSVLPRAASSCVAWISYPAAIPRT